MRHPVRAAASDASVTAIVVFEARGDSRLASLLRPGFAHCFCLLRRSAGWLVCDPLRDRLRLEIVDAYPVAELVSRLSSRSRTLLVGTERESGSSLPFVGGPTTCVEIVKRVVGRPAPWVVTPWQLYKFLLSAPAARPNFAAPEGEHLTSS